MLAIALGRTRTAGARDAIAALLREDDPKLRAAAWIGLAELGDEAARAMLPEGLTDQSADVRLAACQCAKRLQAADCVPALTRLLQSDGDWWVRYRAAQALVTLGAAGRLAILDAVAESNNHAADVGLVVLRECETEAPHAA
jgi:HEAT repeat protein